MEVRTTRLPGVLLIGPRVFADARGYFLETWSEERYAAAGIPGRFVQDNLSSSARGVLRGLHLQHPHGQGKLISVPLGRVFDVVVDVRVGSPTYRQWEAHELSEDNGWQLYVPPGFAHGFCVLSERALFSYKCTAPYRPEHEVGIAWNDPEIGIEWPVREPVVSERDRGNARLGEVGGLPVFSAAS